MNKKFPKVLFNQMLRAASDHSVMKSKFDRIVEDVFGCHYSDFDDDDLIDALDYGTGYCSYDEFVKRMKEHQNEGED